MTAVVFSSAFVSVIRPSRQACRPASPASSGSLTAQSLCRTAFFRSQKAVSVGQRTRTCNALSSNSLDHGVQYANNVVPLEHQVNVGSLVHRVDFVVIGSGIAGLSFALKAAQYGTVAIVTKAEAEEGCTQYAQGGVCAVLDPLDSVESHIRDTFVAGCFLNNLGAVEAVCREGPELVLELAAMGAEFTAGADETLHLTREGGHSHRRIVHAADVTGREIERALLKAVRAQPSVTFFEHHLAADLVIDQVGGSGKCLGVDVLDQVNGRMARFVAPVTMLASGGAGQVYPFTTNPHVSTGDGMAMAARAKAAMANMEFVQFHPTSFYSGAAAGSGRSFLISEAVRGEGGHLYNLGGERFMSKYDERLELAPRDVVARAIQDQMLTRGDSHVLLDISHMPAAETLAHFPNIAAHCAQAGVDITRHPIPVVPAQHYMCGGVQTGLSGQTSVPGLFACGEVACTGLHGANRLASNSLLEGLVFAARAVQPAVDYLDDFRQSGTSVLEYAATHLEGSAVVKVPQRLAPSTAAWVASKREHLNSVMWSAAGIVRNQPDLQAALHDLAYLYVETKALIEVYGLSTPLLELRSLVSIAELIVSSAIQRHESRGLHFCTDYPVSAAEQAHETVIRTSFRRRFDMGQIAPESMAAPHPLSGSSSAVATSRAFNRQRDVAIRSASDPI